MTTIEEGKKAPAFSLESEAGPVSLRDLEGKWVVLYFYPRDATPGCTTEAQAFRDAKSELDARDAVVLGVSKDSVDSHRKFRGKHDLNFALLSDPSAETIAKYGAYGEKTMYGKKSVGIVRTTVLIDPAGNVRKIWPKVRVAGHAEEVLGAIDSLRS